MHRYNVSKNVCSYIVVSYQMLISYILLYNVYCWYCLQNVYQLQLDNGCFWSNLIFNGKKTHNR